MKENTVRCFEKWKSILAPDARGRGRWAAILGLLCASWGEIRTEEFLVGPDQVISPGVPGNGAGEINVNAGTDTYSFAVQADQLVGFRLYEQSDSFAGDLVAQLFAPNGDLLFDDYTTRIRPRIRLTASGTYSLKIYVNEPTESKTGSYKIGIYRIVPDKVFPIRIGDTVSEGQPSAGAGRIESLATEDIYTFTASQGQLIAFESLFVDPAFEENLLGELRTPGGNPVFDDYFRLFKSRVELPESGTYTLRVYVDAPSESRIGEYSFKVSPVAGDSTFPITGGQVVGPGQPAPGAGIIEALGTEDVYTFVGIQGQRATFESFFVSPAFEGNLAAELFAPSGQRVFDDYFQLFKRNVRMPETGMYRLRVYVFAPNDAKVGDYSFRFFLPIQPRPDSIATVPGLKVSIPLEKLSSNDSFQAGDSLSVEMITPAGPSGGQVNVAGGRLTYQPAPGFGGIESIPVRVKGALGGVETNRLTAYVVQTGNQPAHVVNSSRLSTVSTRFCVMGKPGQIYHVLRSPDLISWTQDSEIMMNGDGVTDFVLTSDSQAMRFFQFRFP